MRSSKIKNKHRGRRGEGLILSPKPLYRISAAHPDLQDLLMD